jgi:hypothetical protein
MRRKEGVRLADPSAWELIHQMCVKQSMAVEPDTAYGGQFKKSAAELSGTTKLYA